MLTSPGPESKTSEAMGTIQQVSTVNTNLTGRNVEASEEEPRYEVRMSFPGRWEGSDVRLQIENNRTKKRSAIKESNIIGPAE